ncbi:MAG: RNA degradosome polyphosphate kinase [Bacteroidaceae bacterium]|nr:RNA degradosome polyphosphate kinase [Bacteroidaceae bacterium]
MVKLTKQNYVERDISWMLFNHRILEEAQREGVPVLERLSFLGIYSNNLDEFFRVRMANLGRVATLADEHPTKEVKAEADKAAQQLKTINRLNAKYAKEYALTVDAVRSALAESEIHILRDDELNEEQRQKVYQFYRAKLIGRISPIWFENLHNLDKEADDAIYMIVRMKSENSKARYALFPLPVNVVGRWFVVPNIKLSTNSEQASEGGDVVNVMYLDDVVRACLSLVFPGIQCENFEAWTFKFTRDAEMEIDNDLREGFMQKIQKGVKSRKAGSPVRIVYDSSMPNGALRRIKSLLAEGARLDTAVAGGRYQNHRDFMSFPDCGKEGLSYPKWSPVINKEMHEAESIFKAIREKDRMLHVPYHSFDGYIRLLNEAAIDPKVKSIKTTLYRLAKDSKVIRALTCAALNGKKVTVIIELLARFDEASNISWSKKMQEAGINVIFGVEGLKVHSKITHISFKSGQDIAVVSTGNFHEGNASRYTDVMLMTANRNIVQDVERVFRFIEKPYSPVKFKQLLVSPNEMKDKFLRLIDNEIKNHLAGKPAWIKMKVNHITEPKMVQKIYEAVETGIKVEALVRGNCSLVDNDDFDSRMKIVGIIDRYLEHSRIFIFANGGEPLYFIGSADWMPRNLDCRVEVVTPVYDKDIQKELLTIVDYGLCDTKQGRVVAGYQDCDMEFRSQEALYRHYNDNYDIQSHERPND